MGIKTIVFAIFAFFALHVVVPQAAAQGKKPDAVGQALNGNEEVVETNVRTHESVLSRAWQAGFVVFCVLLILIVFSVMSWALVVAKFLYLGKVQKASETFVKSFWDSRSLNDLNSRLNEHPYSPVKEVFRTGYTELVKGTQLKDQTSHLQLAITTTMDNLGRSLGKARLIERKRMERYLALLSIIATTSPFIGLFGTVWGIMGAFEGIAKSGSASLAAVAPGISEALIATAFGLAAAIPAAIGYNIAVTRIKTVVSSIDNFSADFLNIVERWLVTDKSKASVNPAGPL